MSRIRALMEKAQPKINEVMPQHVDGRRLVRVALAAVSRTPALLDCDPMSILQSVMVAARLGLEPDGVLGSAYMVPRKGKATLLIGYQGLIDLVVRSGAATKIWAATVYERDAFTWQEAPEQRIEHRPVLGDRGTVIGYYASALLANGAAQSEVMSKAEIDEIRQRFTSEKSKAWQTSFDEMARKTVIRRLCKYLPKSVELAGAALIQAGEEAGEDFTSDAAGALGLDIDIEAVPPPVPPRRGRRTIEAIAALTTTSTTTSTSNGDGDGSEEPPQVIEATAPPPAPEATASPQASETTAPAAPLDPAAWAWSPARARRATLCAMCNEPLGAGGAVAPTARANGSALNTHKEKRIRAHARCVDSRAAAPAPEPAAPAPEPAAPAPESEAPAPESEAEPAPEPEAVTAADDYDEAVAAAAARVGVPEGAVAYFEAFAPQANIPPDDIRQLENVAGVRLGSATAADGVWRAVGLYRGEKPTAEYARRFIIEVDRLATERQAPEGSS